MAAQTRSSPSFRLRSSPSLNTLRLRRTFDLFDKNSDGIITVHELSQALARLGLESHIPDLQSIVDSHIKPGLLGLQFDDFQSLHRELDESFFPAEEDMSDQAVVDSDLSEAFKVFDENGDGFISAIELQSVLEKLGFVEEREIGKVEMMIGSVDQNRDGFVDFFEFKDMMRALLVPSA